MSGLEQQPKTSTPKLKQLPLPDLVIEVQLPSGAWKVVPDVPTEGRYRVRTKNTPSKRK